MTINRPSTYRDIAKAAGVSIATVSFALRNRPGVSKPIREHILQVADRLGYQTNPYVAAWMTQRRALRPAKIQAIMGIITQQPMDLQHFTHSTPSEMLKGAEAAASKLGFVIEQFSLPQIERNPRALSKAFATRRMNALLLHVLGEVPEYVTINWEKFAMVSMGRRNKILDVDFVSSDHFSNMTSALDGLQELGYRRIAFLTLERLAGLQDKRYLAAYLGWHSPRRPLAPWIAKGEGWDSATLKLWMDKNKPDAVITDDHTLLNRFSELGFSLPRDLGFAHLDLDVRWGTKVSGIQQNNHDVGVAAVELLTGLVVRNDLGLPQRPHAHLVEGAWVAGDTTRTQGG